VPPVSAVVDMADTMAPASSVRLFMVRLLRS
jgi:microcompartment protein CcmL/EutN